MDKTNLCGENAVLKPWYWYAYAWAPNPSQVNMDKVMGDFRILYQKEEPHHPGQPLATHVYHFQVNDDTPLVAEAVVRHLQSFKVGVNAHLHVEYLKNGCMKLNMGRAQRPSLGLIGGCVCLT